MELEFSSSDFQKNTLIQNFTKIRPMGAELFHAEGQTERKRERDMTKLIVGFRNFANPPTIFFGTLCKRVIAVREEQPSDTSRRKMGG